MSAHEPAELTACDSPTSTDRWLGWVVIAVAIGAVVVAFAVWWPDGLTVRHYDSKSHLVVARRMIDSRTPGLDQHGLSWLPLVHVLQLPFVANDYLYRTGLPGTVIGAICFVLAAGLAYRVVLAATGDPWAALAAGLVWSLNRSLLHLCLQTLTEPLFFAIQFGTVYVLMRWWQRPTGARLAWLAVLVFLGCWTRHSLLIVGFLTTLAVLGAANTRARSVRGARLVAFLLVCAAGPVLYMLYAWYVIGDPLDILHGFGPVDEFRAPS
jgi:hypothetical protein